MQRHVHSNRLCCHLTLAVYLCIHAGCRIKELMGSTIEGRNEEIDRILTVLGHDYTQSNMSNYRKGGLIGLAATALGLANEAHRWLHLLLPPVLRSFTDQDSRVRYYACEVLPTCACGVPAPPDGNYPGQEFLT